MRCTAILLFAATAFAQDPKLDDYLTRLSGFGYSGVALVAKGDQVLIDKGYGLANRKTGVVLTGNSVFSIGSITKQFTAAAILKLEMEGKLQTTDPIGKFFPTAPADKQSITLHQLLTHTAGLRSDYAATDYEPYARDAYMQRIFDAPLLPPVFRYANAGYSMLAAIVEIASGQPYERYLHDHLFAPAGMTMTGYLLPKWDTAKHPHGYEGASDWGTIVDRSWAPDGPWWQLRGNGGIHSTAMDMFRWSRALETNKILSKEARVKFQTGYVNEGPMGQSKYAYGWSVSESPAGKLIEHNGGNRVFSCDFLRYVDAGVTVIVFSNTADFPAPDFSHPLARVALGLDYAQPPKTISLPGATLARYAGTYALPSGGRISITTTVSGIELATTDQEAWGLLQSSGQPLPADVVKRLNAATAATISAAAKGDFTLMKAALGPNPPPGFEQRQTQLWLRHESENGKLVAVRTLGTAPDGPGVATTAELTFEHAKMYMRYLWSPESTLMGMQLTDSLPPARYSPESPSTFVSFTFPGPRITRLNFALSPVAIPTALTLGPIAATRTP